MAKIIVNPPVDYFDNVVDAWLNSDDVNDPTKVTTNPKKLISEIINRNGREDYLSFFPSLTTPTSNGNPIDAMPEPFSGNPCKNLVVFFNFNPAFGNEDVKYMNRQKMKGVITKTYSDFTRPFPHITDPFHKGATNWWEKRNTWLHETFYKKIYNGGKITKQVKKMYPFSIELCPWHSKSKKGIKIQPLYLEKVIKLSEYAYENSCIPIMLALGSSLRDVLRNKNSGYQEVSNISYYQQKYSKRGGCDAFGQLESQWKEIWPQDAGKSRFVNQNFSYFRKVENDKTYKILCMNSNQQIPPADHFNRVLTKIVQYIKDN